MTTGQRRIHRAVWLAMGPLLAMTLIAAVAWRPAAPVPAAHPATADVLAAGHGGELSNLDRPARATAEAVP